MNQSNVISDSKLQMILPVSRAEYVTAISHYYRGEMYRMSTWRNRIDLTTNWAIGAVAAMLSVAFSTPGNSHMVILFAMGLVYLLLMIESRRYRFFDVYRRRVRLLERNFFVRMFSPENLPDDQEWLQTLTEDLRSPRFGITTQQAMARRLRRNYCWMFLILLLAWWLKILVHPTLALRTQDILQHASMGFMPGWLVITLVLVFNLSLLYIMQKYYKPTGELVYGEVHV